MRTCVTFSFKSGCQEVPLSLLYERGQLHGVVFLTAARKFWKFCQEERLGGNDKAFLCSSWEVLSMMGRNLQDFLFWCNVPRPLQVQVDGMSAHSALTAVWRWLGSVGIWLMADDCKSQCLMASSSAPHLYSWRPAVSAQTKGTCIGKFIKAHS